MEVETEFEIKTEPLDVDPGERRNPFETAEGFDYTTDSEIHPGAVKKEEDDYSYPDPSMIIKIEEYLESENDGGRESKDGGGGRENVSAEKEDESAENEAKTNKALRNLEPKKGETSCESNMANLGRQWTKEDTESFISRLEALPELWDASCDSYKDRSKRAASLAALAYEFATETKEVSRKLHNLRTQLNAELRKIKKKKKSGSGADDVFTSGWQFFDALKFMVPSTRIEESTRSNLASENLARDGDTDECPVPLPPPPATKRRNVVQKDDNAVLDSALQLLQAKDEEQIFGDFVASALRNLQSPHLKKTLKIKIQRAVLEVEEMDSAPPTPISAGPSTTPDSWDSDADFDKTSINS